jgi:hypothetical protein
MGNEKVTEPRRAAQCWHRVGRVNVWAAMIAHTNIDCWLGSSAVAEIVQITGTGLPWIAQSASRTGRN